MQSLLRHGLVDEFVILIHPLVLGSGRRLFPDGAPTTRLTLTDTVITTKGVVIATYIPAETGPASGAAAPRELVAVVVGS